MLMPLLGAAAPCTPLDLAGECWLCGRLLLGLCDLSGLSSLFDEERGDQRYYGQGDGQEEGVAYGEHICLLLYKLRNQLGSCISG